MWRHWRKMSIHLIYLVISIVFFTLGYCLGSVSYSKEVEALEDALREAEFKIGKSE